MHAKTKTKCFQSIVLLKIGSPIRYMPNGLGKQFSSSSSTFEAKIKMLCVRMVAISLWGSNPAVNLYAKRVALCYVLIIDLPTSWERRMLYSGLSAGNITEKYGFITDRRHGSWEVVSSRVWEWLLCDCAIEWVLQIAVGPPGAAWEHPYLCQTHRFCFTTAAGDKSVLPFVSTVTLMCVVHLVSGNAAWPVPSL